MGGSLSIVDLLAILYGSVLNCDARDALNPQRDKLVCSKGHAGPAIYAALAIKGLFSYDELKTLNQPHTMLPNHCAKKKRRG